jgi:metal-responsive CopG/Arc/MetJ family transcriptional regulator
MKTATTRTTLTLPTDLLADTDRAVAAGQAKSRNEFVEQAIRRELAVRERAEIDAALVEMTIDPEYQATVIKMEAEFATAQWEALATK